MKKQISKNQYIFRCDGCFKSHILHSEKDTDLELFIDAGRYTLEIEEYDKRHNHYCRECKNRIGDQ